MSAPAKDTDMSSQVSASLQRIDDLVRRLIVFMQNDLITLMKSDSYFTSDAAHDAYLFQNRQYLVDLFVTAASLTADRRRPGQQHRGDVRSKQQASLCRRVETLMIYSALNHQMRECDDDGDDGDDDDVAAADHDGGRQPTGNTVGLADDVQHSWRSLSQASSVSSSSSFLQNVPRVSSKGGGDGGGGGNDDDDLNNFSLTPSAASTSSTGGRDSLLSPASEHSSREHSSHSGSRSRVFSGEHPPQLALTPGSQQGRWCPDRHPSKVVRQRGSSSSVDFDASLLAASSACSTRVTSRAGSKRSSGSTDVSAHTSRRTSAYGNIAECGSGDADSDDDDDADDVSGCRSLFGASVEVDEINELSNLLCNGFSLKHKSKSRIDSLLNQGRTSMSSSPFSPGSGSTGNGILSFLNNSNSSNNNSGASTPVIESPLLHASDSPRLHARSLLLSQQQQEQQQQQHQQLQQQTASSMLPGSKSLSSTPTQSFATELRQQRRRVISANNPPSTVPSMQRVLSSGNSSVSPSTESTPECNHFATLSSVPALSSSLSSPRSLEGVAADAATPTAGPLFKRSFRKFVMNTLIEMSAGTSANPASPAASLISSRESLSPTLPLTTMMKSPSTLTTGSFPFAASQAITNAAAAFCNASASSASSTPPSPYSGDTGEFSSHSAGNTSSSVGRTGAATRAPVLQLPQQLRRDRERLCSLLTPQDQRIVEYARTLIRKSASFLFSFGTGSQPSSLRASGAKSRKKSNIAVDHYRRYGSSSGSLLTRRLATSPSSGDTLSPSRRQRSIKSSDVTYGDRSEASGGKVSWQDVDRDMRAAQQVKAAKESRQQLHAEWRRTAASDDSASSSGTSCRSGTNSRGRGSVYGCIDATT